MLRVIVRHCGEADAEHAESMRQYAHTYHRAGNVICVAQAFFDLPPKIKAGILFHEMGHLAGAVGEQAADRLIEELMGIQIHRVDTRYGDNLESI